MVPPPARASEVEVDLEDHQGACAVEGRFEAPVPASVAWQVLTDYDGIGRFVHSMRQSRLERQPDGRTLLRQDAVSGFLFAKRQVHVLLELDETAGRRIGFRDVLGRDFRSYQGEWRIEAAPGGASGVSVEYHLSAEPRSAFARMVCRGVMKKAAEDLLGEVRAEMVRRATAR